MRKGLLGILLFTLILVLTACPAVENKLGKLDIVISGLSTGVDAKVTLEGPDDFSQELTESQILNDLAVGSYTVIAAEVSSTGKTYTATVSGSPASVTANNTASVTVSYQAEAPLLGSLKLTVSGLPAGTDANITVSGPNSFNRIVTESTTLGDLEPGDYTVSAANALTSSEIVSEVFSSVVTGSPATITPNATASISIGYTKIEGSGLLWIPSVTTTIISGYTAAQLTSSGSPTPEVSFTAPVVQNHEAIAFDGAGNLWVAFSGVPESFIKKYASSDLGSSGGPSPSVTISGSSLSSLNGGPVGLAFDAEGGLWVVNFFTNTLLKYGSDQLLSSGSPTPAVTISADAGGSLDGSTGIAFDNTGNLWVSNFNASTLVQYTPDQLTATGSPTPAVTISADVGGSLDGSTGIAFDNTGNLWVSNFNASTLVQYTPDQLTATGSPTPAVTISADVGGSLNTPAGLAFDNSGNLWVVNDDITTLIKYNMTQLASSGSPTPEVAIDGLPEVDVGQLAFSPPATELPINTP